MSLIILSNMASPRWHKNQPGSSQLNKVQPQDDQLKTTFSLELPQMLWEASLCSRPRLTLVCRTCFKWYNERHRTSDDFFSLNTVNTIITQEPCFMIAQCQRQAVWRDVTTVTIQRVIIQTGCRQVAAFFECISRATIHQDPTPLSPNSSLLVPQVVLYQPVVVNVLFFLHHNKQNLCSDIWRHMTKLEHFKTKWYCKRLFFH